GALEYLGRIDSQVKLRGFRIEPGEIETTLQAHPAVQEAVVILREEDEARRYLVAYVVVRAGSSPEASQMQEYLHKQLPDYMVPTFIVFLESMPLTPNGKVDRVAIGRGQAPQAQRSTPLRLAPDRETLVTSYTPLQELLGQI